MNENLRRLRTRPVGIGAVTVGCALVTLLALNGPAYAQAQGVWKFQIEAINMEACGNDVHVASILVSDFTAEPIEETVEGIDVELEGNVALRVEIEYMRNQWGWGMDAWSFDTDGLVSRSGLTSSFFPPVLTSVLSDVPGMTDLAPPAFLGELNFTAENQLEVWTVDLYGIRTLAGSTSWAGTATRVRLL